MSHMVLFDEKAFIRNRIRGLLSMTDIRVHEASSFKQLVNLVDHDAFKVDLIMADLNFDDTGVVEQMKVFRNSHSEVPLIVFTSSASRKVFVSAIKLGANDFLLKSAEDDIILTRIRRNIGLTLSKNDTATQNDKVSINITRYLAGEIRKAQKGNYALTVCFSSIMASNGQGDANINVSPRFLNQLQGTYWETDVLVSLGMNHFVNFFPFCDSKHRPVVESKLQSIFETLKESDVNLSQCQLVNDYVTFPEDGLTKEEILTKMIEKMNRK